MSAAGTASQTPPSRHPKRMPDQVCTRYLHRVHKMLECSPPLLVAVSYPVAGRSVSPNPRRDSPDHVPLVSKTWSDLVKGLLCYCQNPASKVITSPVSRPSRDSSSLYAVRRYKSDLCGDLSLGASARRVDLRCWNINTRPLVNHHSRHLAVLLLLSKNVSR